MLFGKKKRNIAFLLGCLWYYIKRMEDVENATKATDFMVEICVKLGIDWDTVNDAERAYQTSCEECGFCEIKAEKETLNGQGCGH